MLPGSRQTEVADLEVAVGVEQQIGGLQVSVQHICGVDVLQPPQQLRRQRKCASKANGII